MPLVTRQANQAAVFKQDADPATSAEAGDLWSETDTNSLFRRNDADTNWLEVIPSPVVTALQLNDTSAIAISLPCVAVAESIFAV